MRLVLLLPLLLILALVACDSRSSPATPASKSASASPVDPNLPITFHGIEGAPTDAALVATTKAGVVSVDGVKVGEIPKATATATAKKPARIDALFEALHARSDTWKKAHPGESFPGHVAFTFDRDELASVVKSVVVTAGHAAHPYGALLVRVPAATGGELVAAFLNMDVRIDDPKKAERERERELHLNLSSHGVVLVKWLEANGKMLGEIVPSGLPVAKLATDIGRGWNERGLHREPTDKRFDQAILHVDSDTPYALIVVTLDAVHATKRKLAVAGREELVPAITVTLAVD